MIYLPKAVAVVRPLVAKSKARYALTCVRVKELPGQHWRIEATDGRALAILRGPSAPTAEDLASAQALPVVGSLATEGLICVNDWVNGFRAVPREGRLGVRLSRDEVLLTAGGEVLVAQHEEGSYPDVDTVLPRRPALVSIRLDGELLVQVVKAAVAVARTKEDSRAVELLWWGHDQPIGVIAQGADGITFDGLIMPLVESGPSPR